MQEPSGFMFPPSEMNARAKSVRLMDLFSKCEEFIYMNADMPFKRAKPRLIEMVTGKKTVRESVEDMFADYAELKYEGTRLILERTCRKVLEFDRAVTFDAIDKKWLERFAAWLEKDGANVNGIAHHMRNLRAVVNYAIDEEITSTYGFRKYRIKQTQTAKRDLTVEQLRVLRDYPCNSYLAPYRDMFLLIFYLCGINVGDLLLLKRENVKNGRVEYYRRKTKKYYSIRIEPEADIILNRYEGKEYLLYPMDTNSDYHIYLKHLNEALGRIGMDCGKGKKPKGTPLFPGITTYYARHTWASIAAEVDVPMDVIGQALGHTTPYTTTEIYVNRRLRKIDEANRKVIDFLMGN